jgi:hypothetical protein
MHKFTHIESFQQVCKFVEYANARPDTDGNRKQTSKVSFRGTVKLHGTNAGVCCTSTGISTQSRSRVITPEDDNAGFSAFMQGPAQREAIREIEKEIRERQDLPDHQTICLYGEWCGPGIMKGTALNQLPSRQLVLFSVAVASSEADSSPRYLDVLTPFEDRFASAQIYSILDAPTYLIDVDFEDKEHKQASFKKMSELVDQVERVCPWGARFGISGVGEGIVFTPIGEHWGNSNLFFKVKGDKHKVTSSRKKTLSIDPEVLGSLNDFLDYSMTENRLEQGIEVLKEKGLTVEMKSMGTYLKWVCEDIKRECALELEASGIDWNIASKAIASKARDWFKEKTYSL